MKLFSPRRKVNGMINFFNYTTVPKDPQRTFLKSDKARQAPIPNIKHIIKKT